MLVLFCVSPIQDSAFPFRWIVDMEGAPGTLYEGEKFQLLFKFSSRYPFDSPQVSANIWSRIHYLLVCHVRRKEHETQQSCSNHLLSCGPVDDSYFGHS